MVNSNNSIIDTSSFSDKLDVVTYLEERVMPLLCGDVESKLDKIPDNVVLTLEHIPGAPLSVLLHYKDGIDNVVAKQLVNRFPKLPRNHGSKWTKPHIKKLRASCDARDSLDSMAKKLERRSSSVLAKLQEIAKDEMWAYQYLVDSFLPVQYYKS